MRGLAAPRGVLWCANFTASRHEAVMHPTSHTISLPPLPRTVQAVRLAAAWAVMLGGLVGYWFVRPLFSSALAWTEGTAVVLFASSKLATLLWMPRAERRRLSWGRFAAYLFWPGMQPRHFLPERRPADARPAPTVAGMLLNAATAALLLWVVPGLMPGD